MRRFTQFRLTLIVITTIIIGLAAPVYDHTSASPAPPPVEQEEVQYVWAGYVWDWWGGFIHIHLTPGEQAYILQGGTVALAAIAAQACSLTGPWVWACIPAVAIAGYTLFKQVEAYNGSCDELILYVTPWTGYVYNAYCWNDEPSGGGTRGYG